MPSNPQTITLDELSSAYIRGEEQAVVAFLEFYSGKVKRQVRSGLYGEMLWQEADAEDILAEAVITFLQKLRTRQFRKGEAEASDFFIGIVKNTLRSHVRKKRTDSRRIQSLPPTTNNDPWTEEFVNLLADSSVDIEETVIVKQALQECFQRLTERRRMLLVLFFIEGLSLLEIAAATSINEGTVRSGMFYAREAMKRCLRGKDVIF